MEYSSATLPSLPLASEPVHPSPFEADPAAENTPELIAASVRAADPAQSGAVQSEAASQRNTAIRVFFSTFVTIFLAELGDKTQLTTLLMAAESHAPWVVFAGAGAALVATSLIGVWLGCWLAKRVSPKTLETTVGILLLLVSAQLFWDVIQL